MVQCPPERTRISPFGTFEAARPYTISGGNVTNPPTRKLDAGKSTDTLKISDGNPFPYRTGSNFYQVSSQTRRLVATGYIDSRSRTVDTHGYGDICKGPVCYSDSVAYPPIGASPPSYNGLASVALPYGPKGWNRTRPSRPIMDLSQSLGELKDVPSLTTPLAGFQRIADLVRRGVPAPRSTREFARTVGQEYLNVDFGWAPLLSDIGKLLEFQETFNRRMEFLRKNNGKSLRRRLTLVDSTTNNVSETPSTNVGAYLTCGAHGSWQGKVTTETISKRKIWYSAGYRLHFPDLSTPDNIREVRNALLGTRPSISTVWELTPWSFLADWVTNIGDNYANLSDPLRNYYAASYAFLMVTESRTVRRTVNAYQMSTSLVGTRSLSVSAETSFTVKARYMASPFGFGLTWDTLSASQQATAAALGISRK